MNQMQADFFEKNLPEIMIGFFSQLLKIPGVRHGLSTDSIDCHIEMNTFDINEESKEEDGVDNEEMNRCAAVHFILTFIFDFLQFYFEFFSETILETGEQDFSNSRSAFG